MILVTGGTGHLGTELVPRLLAHGAAIRVLTRNPERARHVLGSEPEFICGDVRDPGSLQAGLHGADAVVSAMTGFGPGADGPRAVDYAGNLNLIRAAEAQHVRRFVLVSVHGAAPDHPMELARMKYLAEESLRRSALDWVIVRPTAFMHLWLGLVGDPIVNAGKTRVFGRGDNPINFVSEEDVAQVVALTLCDAALNREVIEVGGPDDVTFNELVEQIARVSHRDAKVSHIPVGLMHLARLLMRRLRPDIADLIEGGIAFETLDMRFDTARLRGRFPQLELHCLAEVVRQHFAASPVRT